MSARIISLAVITGSGVLGGMNEIFSNNEMLKYWCITVGLLSTSAQAAIQLKRVWEDYQLINT